MNGDKIWFHFFDFLQYEECRSEMIQIFRLNSFGELEPLPTTGMQSHQPLYADLLVSGRQLIESALSKIRAQNHPLQDLIVFWTRTLYLTVKLRTKYAWLKVEMRWWPHHHGTAWMDDPNRGVVDAEKIEFAVLGTQKEDHIWRTWLLAIEWKGPIAYRLGVADLELIYEEHYKEDGLATLERLSTPKLIILD